MALAVMRRHRRWLYVFLWLVIAAFIILYVPAFQGASAGSPGEALVKVGNLKVTTGEFQKAYLRQRQFYERLYQGKLDAAALQRLGLEEQTLDRLVEDRLVVLESRRLGIKVDDDALVRNLETAPEFKDESGAFIGGDEIRRRLELAGVSLADFEEELRGQMLRRKLQSLVTDAVRVTPEEAEREFRRNNEQVKLEYVVVDAARHRGEIQTTDEELKARFEAEKESYRTPEQRSVSYALIDAQALQSRVSVTESDVEAYYREHSDQFRQEEQACASHILVKVKANPADKQGHDDAAALKLAQGLLEKAKAGEDFAQLARQSSEDPGSKDGGGDLGCFERGRMVPEFENAAFSLEPGQLSDVIKTQHGYHVIRLRSRVEAGTRPLAEVQPVVRASLQAQRVRARAQQDAQQMASLLAGGRSLADAAKELGLTVQKSAQVTRAAGVRPVDGPQVLAKVFELKPDEVAKQPLSVPQGYLFIAAPVVQASRIPDFKDVQDRVRADVIDQKAAELARAQAAALRTQALSGGLEKAAKAAGLSRKETPSLVGRGQPLGELGSGLALEKAAFELPDKTLSEPVKVAGGWAIFQVIERKAFDPDAFAKQRAMLTAQLREDRKAQMFRAYLREARQRFPIERKAEALNRVVGREG